jgi:hypothetical protein
LFTLLIVGCGGPKQADDDDEDYRPAKKASKQKASGPATSLKPVKASEFGILKGKITWEGNEPDFERETARLKSLISGSQDRDYCLTGKLPGDPDTASPIRPCESEQQVFRLGKNKGLGNVFVWIQPEAGHFFEISAEQINGVAKEVVLQQPHCAFLPHCLVLFPSYRGADGKQTPTGQQFLVENDARVGHNAKVQGGPLNSGQGSSIPARKPDGSTTRLPIVLKPDSQPVSVACDIHGWMKAWVRVFDHPYAAVSSVGADTKAKVWENLESPAVGTYEIKGVPVGAKVKLFAWHEELGLLPGSGKEITLKKDQVEDFTAKLK